MRNSLIICVSAMLLLGRAAFAGGGGETWFFDETTTGQDILWTSPTAVDPDAPLYHAEYEITLVEIYVEWLGIPFGPFDVTDEIPPESRIGAGEAPGPAPVTILDQYIAFPEPPEPPSMAADLAIGLDENGFGVLSATNVVLGTLTIDLGPPFGEQDVELTSLRIAGQLTIIAVLCPADFDDDGVVGASDLAQLLGSWGACPACPADFNFDGVVSAADLAQLLGAWGRCPT